MIKILEELAKKVDDPRLAAMLLGLIAFLYLVTKLDKKGGEPPKEPAKA